MTGIDVTLFTSRMEINIAPEENDHFKDAIHLMPKWRLTVSVSVKFLINIDAPVIKCKMYYTTLTPTANYHVLI